MKKIVILLLVISLSISNVFTYTYTSSTKDNTTLKSLFVVIDNLSIEKIQTIQENLLSFSNNYKKDDKINWLLTELSDYIDYKL
ncbi:MAG: hypothetical protein LBC61_02430 [Candidatus Peribacteria bacterium]|jgi:hypothetical protein|nr:hypothetical protein [Candidatus Peribacteria bacterium]